MARDALRPSRPDDDARTDRLRRAIRVDEFDVDPVGLRLHLGRRDPSLDHPAERREMGLEGPLGLVLRQAALEFAAAVDAIVAREGKLGHVRWAVQAETPDVFGGIEKWRQQADGIEDIEGAGLDRRGARLAVRPHLPFDEPRFYAVAGEFGGGEEPGRASANDQDIVSTQSSSRGKLAVSDWPIVPPSTLLLVTFLSPSLDRVLPVF
jgi:hypothetical protein